RGTLVLSARPPPRQRRHPAAQQRAEQERDGAGEHNREKALASHAISATYYRPELRFSQDGRPELLRFRELASRIRASDEVAGLLADRSGDLAAQLFDGRRGVFASRHIG